MTRRSAPPPLHADPASPTGNATIFHNPAQALNEIATYHPIGTADLKAKTDAQTLIGFQANEFCSKRNWSGHVVSGALVLDTTRSKIALLRRSQPISWSIPDSHYRLSDRTLFEGALTGAAEKLSVKHRELTPMASQPLYMHTDPFAARGQQQPHNHHVVTYGFILKTDDIKSRKGGEYVELLGFDAALQRLGPLNPAAPLVTYLARQFG